MAPINNLHYVNKILDSGADIVYGGIKGWSLRPNMFEMRQKDFIQAIKKVKSRGKKIFLAMNCFYSTNEIEKAIEMIAKMYALGIDGVIISELGLAGEIKKQFPHLDLHLSVQTSASNSKDLEFYNSLGIDCVVLPRNLKECSVSNINKLSKVENIGIEIFILGDDSCNLDGRCYLSSYLCQKVRHDSTGRDFSALGSANKSGYCFLICKRQCSYFKDGGVQSQGRLLKRGDLVIYKDLKDLVSLGIKVLKVQGREFSPFISCRMVSCLKNMLLNLENADKYNKTVSELESLIKLKQRIQDRHLYLLEKSSNKIWRLLREFLQRPIDGLEILQWQIFH